MADVVAPNSEKPLGSIKPFDSRATRMMQEFRFVDKPERVYQTSELVDRVPFPTFNIWFQLIHGYERAWYETQLLYEELHNFFEGIDSVDNLDWHDIVGSWGTNVRGSSSVKKLLSPQELVDALQFLVNTFEDLIDETDTMPPADVKFMLDKREKANATLNYWKCTFTRSHVHVFFGFLRCLGQFELLVNPFKFYATGAKYTMEDFLLRFSWETVGLYYMVCNFSSKFYILNTITISYQVGHIFSNEKRHSLSKHVTPEVFFNKMKSSKFATEVPALSVFTAFAKEQFTSVFKGRNDR
jgi:hypothetical protein